MEERITVVGVGEIVPVTPKCKMKVQPACEDKHNGHWFCVTHNKHLDNQFQKDAHCYSERPNQKHKMAWVCNLHGLEKP